MSKATPQEIIGLDQALSYATEDQLVEFVGDTIRLHDLVATGESEVRGAKAGNLEVYANVPVREPLLSETVPFRLSEADHVPQTNATKRGDNPEYKIIHPLPNDPEVLTWRAQQVSPEMVVNAATNIVAERPDDDDEATVECGNCDGQQTFHLDCYLCSSNSRKTVFIDMEDDSDSIELVDEPAESEPCSVCHGAGSYDNSCPRCGGSGKMDLHPTLELVNDTSGESTTVHLNVPRLIMNGLLKVMHGGYETNEYAYAKGESRLFLGLNQFLHAKFSEIGIDTERAHMVRDGAIFDPWMTNPSTNAQWISRRTEEEPYRSGTYGGMHTARDIVLNFESQVAYSFIEPVSKHLAMRARRSSADTLHELRSLVEARGYTLAVGIGFIATEEYGPQLFAMDTRGNIVGDLGSDYVAQTAMETAIGQLR